MGSSSEDPNKGLDISVGGLVWVRRRNGSWWPGRILGSDELPEGCLPTPRSGTPVKLLGREDASVDWYNLEKSKRVKAFRCGEYDDCIEKAKASACQLSKKAVKYARREDAILHALELETARIGKDYPISSPKPNPQAREQNLVEESPSSSHRLEEGEDINEGLNSPPEMSHSGVSFEEPHHIKEEPKRRRTPNDSEDEGVKRMRGLEDLGMGKPSPPRRKRCQGANANEFLKKKNRRRPLAKVLECTPMVFVPVVSDQLTSPTGLECNESKINDSFAMNNNSDSNGVSCENAASLVSKTMENEISGIVDIPGNESANELFDVPLVAEEKPSAGLSTNDTNASEKLPECSGAQSSHSSHVETISLGNEEHNETGSTSSDTVDLHNPAQILNKGASEWQLKGKRNSRPRKTEIDDEDVAGPRHGWSWNSPHKDSQMAPPQRLLPYRQSRLTINPKYDSSDFSLRHHTGSGLYDVDVEVKTSHPQQRVPYISLMSKSRGQPVIGHPLSIEVLEDGFCDEILGFSECYSSSSELDRGLIYVGKPRGRPPTKRSAKCPRGRRNRILSKKIRTLSSLTSGQRQNHEKKKFVVEKKIKGPSIACVPLNVVFSRINAALNGSMQPASRGL